MPSPSLDATEYPTLFSPGRIGSVTLRNRVVQLPMGTSLIEHAKVTDREVAFQEERARGGVGLIITGAAIVHETSRFPERIQIEAFDEQIIDSLRLRVDAVKRHGACIFGQILHLGREQPGGVTNYPPWAPSPVPSPRSTDVPHEMTVPEVRMIVDGFGRSARNFQAAGYDGVEIHAAHGYLVAQFLSPASNRRSDAYRGDTLEGRTRLLVELVREIRARCRNDFPIGVRLSADEETTEGMGLDDALEIVDELQSTAPADYLSITVGMRGAYIKDSSVEEGFALDLVEAVKEIADVPVIAAGRFRLPDLAERALAAGRTDFIGVGRALLADPQWAEKARAGRSAQIRPCIGFVQDCRVYAGGVTCAVNARVGREAEWGGPGARPVTTRRVVVAGGGPAGLETARLAAESGHDVVLLECEDALGGQVRVAAAGPTREQLQDVIFYLEREVKRLGVELRLGTPATADTVLMEEPDFVVCATGATPSPPAFPVDADARVVTVWDLLSGSVADIPPRAAVVEGPDGFWHAISAAEYLAERGIEVELLTAAPAVGLSIPHESIAGVHRRLRGNGVSFRPFVTVASVHGSTISLADSVTGEPLECSAELVVVRTPMRVNDELARELDGAAPAVAMIGDCLSPRRITQAMLEANLAVRALDRGMSVPYLWRHPGVHEAQPPVTEVVE
jgi:2,4-dienoyl-CoA reductase-like NADH-dependent reductase (Old Yellow Enzyme family)